MALVSPIKLSDEDKLETLQRLDQFWQWHSLDEKRYCLVCGKIITGRQIQVIGADVETGRCASFVPQNIVMRFRWIGCGQPMKS